MEGAPFQPWTAGTGEDAPVKRERDERPLDAGRLVSLQRAVESSLGAESRQRVAALVQQTELLTALERLLLYLKLPAGPPHQDPLKQPLNALGSRSEIQQTVTWIQTHLEVDTEVSLPKQDVYDEYIAFCMSSNMKPLSTADFGKVMKQVYPQVRPRRLGTRGNSRYCYAGLRKRIKLEVPQLPDLFEQRSPRSGSSSAGEVKPEGGGVAGGAGDAERIVCEWAEGVLGVKVQSLPELAAQLKQTPAAPPAPSAAPQPELSPTRHLPPLGVQLHDPQGEGVLSAQGSGSGVSRNPRQLLGQLKRKIQLQSASSPKKNKPLEIPELQPLSSLAPKPPHPHPHDERNSAYPYPGNYLPSYEPRAPYAAYPGVQSHPPVYRESYRLPSPYLPPHSLAPEAPYATHLPINLSSDASTSYPPTLDLSPPTRHEWPPERPPDPPQPPPQPVPHVPAKLPLPGKKMILEQYHNETQSGSLRHRAARAPTADQPPHTYLPKKMRASESLGGKLAAARQAAAAAVSATEAPPPIPTASEPEQPAEPFAHDFLGDPKNCEGRSKSIAAALVRTEVEATRATARGRPRCRRSPGAGRGRGGRGRRRRTSPPRPPTPETCCGLDGINLKTGIICKENHSEILNRERVISICSMDKHALDDYLNEGSSQEHEEELMQYFQHSDSCERPATDRPPSNTAANDKLSQLRELLAKNLKNQSGSNSQSVPVVDCMQAKTAANLPSDGCTTASGSFKPIVGPNVTGPSKENVSQTPENTHRQAAVFDKRHTQQLLPNRVPGGPNCEFDEIPESPASRMQQYDFVPISPSRRSPIDSRHSPIERPSATDIGAPVRSPLPQSTHASPFVSPRATPIPRSRLHTKPCLDKVARKKSVTCGMSAVGSEARQRQISFAVPVDQKCVPKSPGFCHRVRHESRLPMSAPPSPNILSSRYKSQFQLVSGHTNGNSNGFASVSYGMSNNSMYNDGTNGDCTPHSADPLSSEVSQFFHEPLVHDGSYHDEATFRSQSVPLHKQMGCRVSACQQLSYNSTPAGSVPPTPIPNEFCDFEGLSETCEAVSKAGLNSESLDKIYNVLDSGAAGNVLDSHRQLNGVMELNSLLPAESMTEKDQFAQNGTEINELLKRSSSMELDLSEMGLVMDKSRYLSSRSVPSTPLPYVAAAATNGMNENHGHYPPQPSKSVPSTPLLGEENGAVFSYSNRDFLINGHALEVESGALGGLLELHKPLEEPLAGAEELQDILREDCMELPQLPTTDLLADLETTDHAYSDL